MNTYSKFCPNVFLAKCPEKHEKGETIPVTTQHGKENDCLVFNLIYERDGFYFYSIVRADGFNVQEWASRRAEQYQGWAESACVKSEAKTSQAFEMVKGIPMGQPIQVGHHSEKRHRNLLEKSWNALGKGIELADKASRHEEAVAYWKGRASTINLSMPESLDYYEFELEKAREAHEGLKSGTIQRSHSFSLTYAKKDLNETEKKMQLAIRLWG